MNIFTMGCTHSYSHCNCFAVFVKDCYAAAQTGTIYTGQHATQPSNSYYADKCTYFQNGDGTDCYLCNSGYEWNSTDCCMSNAASGSTITCSGDADCCSGHCSDYVPGANGGPLASNDWHCCASGEYWDITYQGQGGCVASAPCYDTPCPETFPNTAWWNYPACIDQDRACCYTDKVSGFFTYDYLPNVMY